MDQGATSSSSPARFRGSRAEHGRATSFVFRPFRSAIRTRFLLFVVLSLGLGEAYGAVVINEFVAASSERRLVRNPGGVATVGSGLSWTDPAFSAASWSNGLLPAGYGFSGLATDLTSQMKDKTPSLYLRKQFLAASELAGSTNQLVLSVQYNDGLVAYLNGREVARLNCGPTNHFVFVSEPAANVNTNTGVVEVALGAAQRWLVPGLNILAMQAHNAEQPSTTNDPGRITKHLPTPEFRINAGLKLAPADTNSSPVDLVPLGPAASSWKYFVGRAEPSGGVVDYGLLTRAFVPPTGEEDDFDTPSAFSDWVELYNNGASAINISGWTLTDDAGNPAKWAFRTNTVLAARSYLLVLCDNRDEANAPTGPATFWHTNFKLNQDGGYIGLYDKTGAWVDSVPAYPPQVVSCSYGRTPADPYRFAFLGTATPGGTNAGPVFWDRASPVLFQDYLGTNLPGGLYTNSTLTLYLRPEVPGQIVRYTLDGSEPSDWNGLTCNSPLLLRQLLDKTGIVVRARSVLPGYVPSKVRTHTYLLRQPVALTTAPALCLTADPATGFYRPDGLLAISGGTYPTSGNIIWLANGPQSYNWAIGDGPPFEREVHLEYYFPPGYYPTNQSPLREDIGIRLSSSSYSRPRLKLTNPAGTSPWANSSVQKPSFNLFFNGEFGPGKLDYNLYTNYTTREFEELRLRAGKNDISNPFITDELMRRLYIDLGQQGSRGLFCSLYLNGIYRGVFNLCERFREQFFQAHFRSDLSWDVNYIGTWVSGDSAAYNSLLTALDRDLTIQANWQAVTNLVDVDNAADYYLLNIYGATWDWPGNNYCIARERSTGPNSRFHFGVWDAEGAFGAITSRKPSYNSFTNDLLTSSSATLVRIFRRLSTSPEFRLLFADHIHARMFNEGMLDDRDPDGAGPYKPRFQQRLEELIQEAGPLVQYQSGQALKQSAFYAWFAPTNSRRSYLLEDVPGGQMFRTYGYWPVTEPPVFSQHGGPISPGYCLYMTSTVATNNGETSTIYFTLDGNDPRRFGGVLYPGAMHYSAPICLTQDVVTVKARAWNTTTREWSPLTSATFAPDALPASAANLVIAEIMYHPPDATAAELAAGYSDADDFEFIRLQNISSSAIDLAGVRFTVGITFDFTASPVRYVGPGRNVLVVCNRAAFQLRYGHGCDALIAGEYGGRLANSGEPLQLVDAWSSTIRAFTFLDSLPWPPAADGDGPSLVLRDPASNPDHSNPAAWSASAVPGGLPSGQASPQSYAAWRALTWSNAEATNNLVSGSAADPDGDGLSNFIEYAFGLDPRRASAKPEVNVSFRNVEEDVYLVLGIQISAAASNTVWYWEQSSDLRAWAPAGASLQFVLNELSPTGAVRQEFQEVTPLASNPPRFYRLRLSGF